MILKNSKLLCRVMACAVALVTLGEAAAQDDDPIKEPEKEAPPHALRALLRSCPKLEEQLTAELSQLQDTEDTEPELEPNWWSSAAILPGVGATELREVGEYGESYRSVRLPSCSVLGYFWHFSYTGGYSLAPQVHPLFFRNGKRVGWHELEKDEQAILLQGMRAGLGSPEAMTQAGRLYRTGRGEESPRSPEAPQDGTRPSNDSVRRTKSEGYLPGKPRSEARTFTPCAKDEPHCGVPATGALFFGTRLTKLSHTDSVDVYSLSFDSAVKEEQLTSRMRHPTRVHFPGDKLVIHDRERDRHAVLFNDSGVQEIKLTRIPGREAFRLEFHTGSFPSGVESHYALLDLENNFLYEHSANASAEPALVEENALCHITCGSDGACRAVHLAQVLDSAGSAGIETVPIDQAPALGDRCESPGVILMSFLLARSDETARSALHSLERLPGWEAPPMRSAARRTGDRAQQVLFRAEDAQEITEGHWPPYPVLGMRGRQAILLVSRHGEIPEELVTGRAAFGAAIAVPRDSLLPMQTAERLSRLERAIAEARLCAKGTKAEREEGEEEEADCESLVATVAHALCQPRLPRQQRQRICQAQRELLPSHQPWEFTEVLKANCGGDAAWSDAIPQDCGLPQDYDEEREAPRERKSWCDRWKTLCQPQDR